ncbi:uncharacterized protein LACBIDRAFT_298650 [Laccaria bicolor S238N-H82]|uniref:Predicted protein n=1 Tax=Laccaria bicolor (strain S238N-H82 / ATCC MYA-4686) TaxID=486041 RepID=B0DDB3_LACBS|nr:uncharacterized protein LACBIDRAFT_298650 [Laccaria bicolor S238N-H82]EDR07585.1 predicted protein [Laccaria bicolor S238N-H82]|eukprot:XP_001881977.1 predicted protein [Laccaria bicolor S238N-H82]
MIKDPRYSPEQQPPPLPNYRSMQSLLRPCPPPLTTLINIQTKVTTRVVRGA